MWVYAEPIIAVEIFTNLLDNAIRYNRPEGTVWISIHESAGSASVSVEDDGPGIPEAERKHVFERFYRLPRDQAQPGSGLGLSIVRTLSEALHAQVSIDAPPRRARAPGCGAVRVGCCRRHDRGMTAFPAIVGREV